MTVSVTGGPRHTRRLSRALRRSQAPDREGRRDPAQRPAAERARREHPRGRHEGGRRALAGHALAAGVAGCATSAPPSPAPTTRSTPPSSRPSTGYGILYWVDAPVYQIPNRYFDETAVRAAAKRAVDADRAQQHQPRVGDGLVAGQRARRQPLRARHRSAPGWRATSRTARPRCASSTTPVWSRSTASRARASRSTSSAYRWLDVLGVNEYFGWYDSYKADLVAPADDARRSSVPTSTRSTRPTRTCRSMITEFGAEALRTGPVEPAGHARVSSAVSCSTICASTRPSRYVARLDPLGAARLPRRSDLGRRRARRLGAPPWNNKSLIEETNARKPAYFDAAQALAQHAGAALTGIAPPLPGA